jgi:hypothetical protein
MKIFEFTKETEIKFFFMRDLFRMTTRVNMEDFLGKN